MFSNNVLETMLLSYSIPPVPYPYCIIPHRRDRDRDSTVYNGVGYPYYYIIPVGTWVPVSSSSKFPNRTTTAVFLFFNIHSDTVSVHLPFFFQDYSTLAHKLPHVR